jgi:hypothetical protein
MSSFEPIRGRAVLLSSDVRSAVLAQPRIRIFLGVLVAAHVVRVSSLLIHRRSDWSEFALWVLGWMGFGLLIGWSRIYWSTKLEPGKHGVVYLIDDKGCHSHDVSGEHLVEWAKMRRVRETGTVLAIETDARLLVLPKRAFERYQLNRLRDELGARLRGPAAQPGSVGARRGGV